MNPETIESDVRQYLISNMGVPDEITAETRLFTSGILDSVMAIEFMLFLESQYNLKISPIDVTIDDLDSIEKVRDFVLSKA